MRIDTLSIPELIKQLPTPRAPFWLESQKDMSLLTYLLDNANQELAEAIHLGLMYHYPVALYPTPWPLTDPLLVQALTHWLVNFTGSPSYLVAAYWQTLFENLRPLITPTNAAPLARAMVNKGPWASAIVALAALGPCYVVPSFAQAVYTHSINSYAALESFFENVSPGARDKYIERFLADPLVTPSLRDALLPQLFTLPLPNSIKAKILASAPASLRPTLFAKVARAQ